MKQILLFFMTGFSLMAQSIPDVKVYYEQSENGYSLFVDNNELCSVSLILNFDLDNLKAITNRQTTFVIPPHQKKFPFTVLKAILPGKYSFNYKYQAVLGNISINFYDLNYAYDLPFGKGQSFLVSQGYNGKMTHKGIYAIDFNLPEGTPIFAIRSGLVIKSDDTQTQHGNSAEFASFNNYILVLHQDGTFANYLHLKPLSAIVKPGDTIIAGQKSP